MLWNQYFCLYMQTHPGTKELPDKPFLHNEDLGVVFRKDRAIRADVETSMKALEAANIGWSFGTFQASREYYIPDPQVQEQFGFADDTNLPDTLSSRPPQTNGTSSRGTNKKRTPHKSKMLDIVR